MSTEGCVSEQVSPAGWSLTGTAAARDITPGTRGAPVGDDGTGSSRSRDRRTLECLCLEFPCLLMARARSALWVPVSEQGWGDQNSVSSQCFGQLGLLGPCAGLVILELSPQRASAVPLCCWTKWELSAAVTLWTAHAHQRMVLCFLLPSTELGDAAPPVEQPDLD